MKKLIRWYCVMSLIIAWLSPVRARAQDSIPSPGGVFALPGKFFHSIDKSSENIKRGLTSTSEKYLKKLSRQERKMQRKLARKDSAAAKEIFGDVASRYEGLKTSLTDSNAHLSNKLPKVYSGHLDSMTTALKFLQKNKVLSQSPEMQQKIQSVFKQYGGVQGKLDQTSYMQTQLKERQQYLKEKLQHLGYAKEFKKYQEQVYYYRAQMDEYKKALEDPKKLEAKLLQVVNKIPAFADFFNKHSQLAGLFRLPGNDDLSGAGLPGLQTRGMVMDQLQQRFGTGPDVQQYMGSSIQTAQTDLSRLKNKVNQLGNSGSDMDMPDFKPNNQKTKSFLKRLELGTNIQSSKSNSFFPVTTDIGLSLGYKLSPKSTAGIGASYKMGWGKDFRHIAITHEGVGLRTFLDIKLKGSFWISGGGELNYLSSFKKIDDLKGFSSWQQSALIGLSKKMTFKAKSAKSTQLQILWDFLSYQQVPRKQPIVIRAGYQL